MKTRSKVQIQGRRLRVTTVIMKNQTINATLEKKKIKIALSCDAKLRKNAYPILPKRRGRPPKRKDKQSKMEAQPLRKTISKESTPPLVPKRRGRPPKQKAPTADEEESPVSKSGVNKSPVPAAENSTPSFSVKVKTNPSSKHAEEKLTNREATVRQAKNNKKPTRVVNILRLRSSRIIMKNRKENVKNIKKTKKPLPLSEASSNENIPQVLLQKRRGRPRKQKDTIPSKANSPASTTSKENEAQKISEKIETEENSVEPQKLPERKTLFDRFNIMKKRSKGGQMLRLPSNASIFKKQNGIEKPLQSGKTVKTAPLCANSSKENVPPVVPKRRGRPPKEKSTVSMKKNSRDGNNKLPLKNKSQNIALEEENNQAIEWMNQNGVGEKDMTEEELERQQLFDAIEKIIFGPEYATRLLA